ncbi:transposable element Tcb2 transposase [Trichonephila clavipes]|nr:transposable element Tcb2 transposase [Trichonephila clavipes]
MRWRIVGRLETGESKIQICREFNLTPIVVFNLWKWFQDIGSIKRKSGEPWTHYLPSDDREIDHYGSGDLMVWTGFTLDSRTHLHVFERITVTAVRFRE